MSQKLVRDVMHRGVITCRAETPLVNAVRTLLEGQLEALIVLDDQGHAVGVLTRREVVAVYGRSEADLHGWETLTVAEVMRPDIPEVPPDIPATVAAQIMLDMKVRELYLMHHDRGICWPAAALCFEDVLRDLVAEPEAKPSEQ